MYVPIHKNRLLDTQGKASRSIRKASRSIGKGFSIHKKRLFDQSFLFIEKPFLIYCEAFYLSRSLVAWGTPPGRRRGGAKHSPLATRRYTPGALLGFQGSRIPWFQGSILPGFQDSRIPQRARDPEVDKHHAFRNVIRIAPGTSGKSPNDS